MNVNTIQYQRNVGLLQIAVSRMEWDVTMYVIGILFLHIEIKDICMHLYFNNCRKYSYKKSNFPDISSTYARLLFRLLTLCIMLLSYN